MQSQVIIAQFEESEISIPLLRLPEQSQRVMMLFGELESEMPVPLLFTQMQSVIWHNGAL
jgi:hypothetical protein